MHSKNSGVLAEKINYILRMHSTELVDEGMLCHRTFSPFVSSQCVLCIYATIYFYTRSCRTIFLVISA